MEHQKCQLCCTLNTEGGLGQQTPRQMGQTCAKDHFRQSGIQLVQRHGAKKAEKSQEITSSFK